MSCTVSEAGGYRFIEGVFQYSGGIAAEPGFAVERARLRRPLPLAEGLAAVEAHLAAIGRPRAAFAACELRSPAPFDEEEFRAFNRVYAGTLERWGLMRGEVNPVARTNVCPLVDPPREPVLDAFSYTVPAVSGLHGGFIVAGGGEAPEGRASYRDHIVCLGDVSARGLREKLRYVMGEMQRRLALLGFGWGDALATRAYTVHDIGSLVLDEIVRAGAARNGLEWHLSRPPIVDLEFEMDVQAPAREIVLD